MENSIDHLKNLRTQAEEGLDPGLPYAVLLPSQVLVVYLGTESEGAITLTEKRLEGLERLIDSSTQEQLLGVVFMASSSGMFSVGADINLINTVEDATRGAELAEKGQKIFQKIENLPVPTVAAISGPCVGGACELVLACDYRLISDESGSSIGLPEVKLGILPGFGGTQRLPRCIGLPNALDVILAGKILRPKQALKRGLVSEVVPFEELFQLALQYALKPERRRSRKLALKDRLLTFTAFGRMVVAGQARKSVLKETKGFYPAPILALECCLFGLKFGTKAGYPKEAKELGNLIVTKESKNLVRLFFLTEASKGIGKSARSRLKDTNVMVIGGGVMGAGIATLSARKGIPVTIQDRDEEGLSRARGYVEASIHRSRSLTEAQKQDLLTGIRYVTDEKGSDRSFTRDITIAIEAVFENLELKKGIFSKLAEEVSKETVLATNTSSLSVTDIGLGIPASNRVIGMHFFNPVEKMPLVEIIRSRETDDRTVAYVAALTTKLGKFPIVVENVPGFLVNRILVPYLNEAGFLLAEGHSVLEIDEAALAFGMPMGPIRLLDEVGIDVADHVSEIMVAGYGDRMKSAGLTSKLLTAKRLGKKAQRGFYDYEGEIKPASNLSELLGIPGEPSKRLSQQALQERLLFPLFNEAIRCLDEGVAGSPGREAARQIDLGTVMGMGFPPFLGGALCYAQTLGAAYILKVLEELDESVAGNNGRFAPAEGLRRRATSGETLCE